MEYVWTTLFVIFLSNGVFGVYLDQTRREYRAAKSNCKLATPRIKFSVEQNTIELNLENGPSIGKKAWVGYTEDMEVFRYFGCVEISSLNLESLTTSTIRTDIGQCQSFCQTSTYFGVKGQEDKTDCYCMNEFDLRLLEPCVTFQTPQEFAFGGPTKLSIYQIATQTARRSLKKKIGWDSDDRNCFCFYNPVNGVYMWEACRTSYLYLCDYGGRETHQVSRSGWWKFAAEHCLSNNASLYANFTDDHLGSEIKAQVWTSYIKAAVITANNDDSDSVYRNYGYIQKKVNGQFELKFDREDENYFSLCSDEEETTSNPSTVATSTTITENDATSLPVRNNAYVSSTEGPNINIEGNNEKVIQNEDNGSSHVGLYIGLPIGVLVVLVVIVFGIFFWRKRKIDTKFRSADNNFKQSMGFSKCDETKSSELRPHSAEYYHEIDDIKRSSLEEYDTINEADIVPTNNGVNNRGYIAHTLAKRDDIKNSNDYDYAKEPGTVEPVVQHSYHPSALMLERENENGYNYAKVLPKKDNKDRITKSDQGFNVSDTETDYDHLDGGYGINNKPKTQHRVGDNANEHVYDKTGDMTNTYDHVNNRLDNNKAPQGGNAKLLNHDANVYNKLADVKLNDDTYNHVNDGQDNNLDTGDYNTTILQKATRFDTDNQYDHTK